MKGLQGISGIWQGILLWTKAAMAAIGTRLGRRRQERLESQQLLALLNILNEARRDLLLAEKYYNGVTDAALIDYASYRIMAARCKYAYCLAEARSQRFNPALNSLLLAAAIRKSTLR